ncbi:VIT1/CCC1 transporter family protein [Specibacter cremeus]|uniref:VIT1/CCC1 transporter family protein n=1 Tax=Specibacter cremeus TaxID=1629051 RepID=UPI000F77BABB|nr:VIT family protein [Specibacter cremeus]
MKNTEQLSRTYDLPRTAEIASRLNWLRAGVLGANDGIVSVAAVVVGVAGVTTGTGPILTAGLAAVVGGAISMALGEYVSVSSQRDSQHAMISGMRDRLASAGDHVAGLAAAYRQKGLSPQTALLVARELSDHDELQAHLDAQLNLDEDEVASPWHAALASAVSFLLGALLPMLAILLPPAGMRVPVTFVAVLVALAATGAVGAMIGGGSRTRASVRVVLGGALALAATFSIGTMLGAAGVV